MDSMLEYLIYSLLTTILHIVRLAWWDVIQLITVDYLTIDPCY